MNIGALWDQLVDCICRPPRDEYLPEDLVGGVRGLFRVSKFEGHREDVVLTNKKGQKLQCSHYIPRHVKGKDGRLPCVVYCHCNSGSRRDAEEAICVLIPLGVSVFAVDFAGSGLSDGQWVTLGAEEVNDVDVVVAHLRATGKVSTLGLWGRSMGAVTALIYSQRDPSIAGVVLDSPFAKLTELMMEIVEEQKLPIPRAFAKVALGLMKRSVRKRAGFDIQQVAPIDAVSQAFIPALFGHATGDTFIKISHSERLHAAYAGDKNLIKFEGDHNSRRPEFFYNSVSIFFHNTLHLDRMLEEGNRLNKELLATAQIEASTAATLASATHRPWQPGQLDLSQPEKRERSFDRTASLPSHDSSGEEDPAEALAREALASHVVNRSHAPPSSAEEEEAQLLAALKLSLMDTHGSPGATTSSGASAGASLRPTARAPPLPPIKSATLPAPPMAAPAIQSHASALDDGDQLLQLALQLSLQEHENRARDTQGQSNTESSQAPKVATGTGRAVS